MKNKLACGNGEIRIKGMLNSDNDAGIDTDTDEVPTRESRHIEYGAWMSQSPSVINIQTNLGRFRLRLSRSDRHTTGVKELRAKILEAVNLYVNLHLKEDGRQK